MTAGASADRRMRIEDALGVCGVRDDTRLLAETAYEVMGKSRNPCRALDLGTGSGYVGHLPGPQRVAG